MLYEVITQGVPGSNPGTPTEELANLLICKLFLYKPTRSPMSYFVYILKSKITGKYYCGQTNDIEDRLYRHNSGQNKYTKHGVPWELIYSFRFETRSEAVRLESKIKKRGIARYLNDVALEG